MAINMQNFLTSIFQIEILQYDFMIRAIIAGIAVGIIAPIIGTFLVVKRFSLIGDTLSHIALSGVALGLLLGINPLLTTVGVTLISSFAIEHLRTTKKISGDAILAIFLPAGLAVSLILLSLAHGFNVNLFSVLFGSISTVTTTDVYLIVALAIITISIIKASYKKLFFVSFDEESAKVRGIKVQKVNLLLVMLTAVVVSIAMRVVGILLIGALMIIPVVAAQQIARSFKQSILISVVIALSATIFGIVFAYYLNLPGGALVVLFCVIAFLLTSLKKTI